MRRLSIILATLFCAPAVYAHHTGGSQIYATIYDEWYHGRTTACGNTYQHWGISAASGSLPCGTRVRLSYRGRSLTVPIRDACECSIDLSAGAAAALGVNGSAVVRISY